MSNAHNMGLQVELSQFKPIPLNVELACENGELLGLVGPSGSGKSTIIRCIAGVASATSGSIYVNGNAWLDTNTGVILKPYQRDVGIVFQNYALFRHMNVYRNIATAMQGCSRGVIDQRVRELLELVNLNGLEHRMPLTLSGGQQQRVALARALARKPKVLLLDEPFSALDLITRKKLRRDLSKIRRSLNIPVVLVTHDHEEACQLADNLCLLQRGCTLDTDSPRNMINKPKTPQIARLLGLTNIFQGKVISHSIEHNTTTISWCNRIIETPFYHGIDLDDDVFWVAPENAITIHAVDSAGDGENHNPNTISGYVRELICMGETTFIEFAVNNSTSETMSFSTSTHMVECLPLCVDQDVTVLLNPENVHLMHAPTDRVKPALKPVSSLKLAQLTDQLVTS